MGSGWSPAYTVTTLLIQLQSVLSDLGDGMPQKQRDVTYQSAVRFCEQPLGKGRLPPVYGCLYNT